MRKLLLNERAGHIDSGLSDFLALSDDGQRMGLELSDGFLCERVNTIIRFDFSSKYLAPGVRHEHGPEVFLAHFRLDKLISQTRIEIPHRGYQTLRQALGDETAGAVEIGEALFLARLVVADAEQAHDQRRDRDKRDDDFCLQTFLQGHDSQTSCFTRSLTGQSARLCRTYSMYEHNRHRSNFSSVETHRHQRHVILRCSVAEMYGCIKNILQNIFWAIISANQVGENPIKTNFFLIVYIS